MYTFSKYLIIFFALIGTSAIYAQQPQSQNANTDVQKQLQEARARLEKAARDVAELSGRAYGQTGNPMLILKEIHRGQPRAMLGVNISGVQGDGKSDGVKILGVGPDSPADNAGLQAGDELLSIDGKPLTGASSAESSEILLKHMAGIEPGKSVTVEYQRGGKKHKVTIKTAAIPLPMSQHFGIASTAPGQFTPVPVPFFNNPFAHQWGDLELAGLSPRLGKYFGTETGVLVIRAPKDDAMKLEDGDVILSIGGRQPNDPGHAMRILRSYAKGEKLTMEIMRDKRHHKLEMTVPEGNDVNIMHRTAPGAPGAMNAPAAPPRPQVFHLQRRYAPPAGLNQAPPPGSHQGNAPI